MTVLMPLRASGFSLRVASNPSAAAPDSLEQELFTMTGSHGRHASLPVLPGSRTDGYPQPYATTR